MTYYVSGGTLNPTHSLTISQDRPHSSDTTVGELSLLLAYAKKT